MTFVKLVFLSIFATCANALPFRVLVDKPGRWEIEWNASEFQLDTLQTGDVSIRHSSAPSSDVPGDLAAPRLQAVLALPTSGNWKIEILVDSTQALSGQSWTRVLGFNQLTGRVASVTPRDRDGWSEVQHDGFRLLRMDFPLVIPTPIGVSLRKRLVMRLNWTGAAAVPAGNVWRSVVDNPGGLSLPRIAAPRQAAGSVDAEMTGSMVEVSVGDQDPFGSSEDGLVRLKGKELSKVSGLIAGGISFSNIAVYSGLTGTAPVEMGDSLVAPRLQAIPIRRIDNNADGILDPTDEIQFWAHGPNLWVPDSVSVIGWNYMIHPYSTRRKYLVRLDAPTGSSELKTGLKSSGANVVQSVGQPIWVGRPDKLRELEIGRWDQTETDMGKDWYWYSVERSGKVTLPFGKLPFPNRSSDTILAQPVTVQTSWYSGTVRQIDSFGVVGRLDNWRLLDPSSGIWSGTIAASSEDVGFQFSVRGSRIALAGLNLLYRRDVSNADSAVFPAPTAGAFDLKVADGKSCWVLENGMATRLCSIESGHLLDSASSSTWYAVFPKGAGGIPVSLAAWSAPLQAHSIKDFNASRTADILVIAPNSMMDLAEEYAVHREASFQIRPMKTMIARAEDVYSLWSGGQMDPVAIRDCIRWAYKRWNISHVLLFGGGHADPRSVLGTATEVQIPQWEDGSVATDDFFTFLSSGDPFASGVEHLSSVALGRVPARSVNEARAWLNKLEIFENPAIANFGPWRNTVVMAADDVWQVGKPDPIPDHTNQTEGIADAMLAQRPWMRQEKLYLVKYPATSIYQKPEAARDLQILLNRGAIGMNYIGHGGQTILADEDLLDNSSANRNLANGTRPFFFFAGSCTVGRNDVPSMRGLSEILLVTEGKGAMATVSATRPSYPTGNVRLNTRLWQKLADTGKASTVGEALLASKSSADEGLYGNYTNRDIYNILGDPATILLPGGLSLQTEGFPDTVQALSKMSVRVKSVGAKSFHLRLEMQSKLDSADPASAGQSVQRFRLSPPQIYSMQAAPGTDTFSAPINVPARIPFGDSAVLSAYAWNPMNRKDGGQMLTPRLLHGTESGGQFESIGPQITFRPCDSSWSSGVPFGRLAQIQLPFCLSVDLEDSSGISSETGPDEGVVFSIPGTREPWHPDLRQGVDYRRASAQLVIDSTLMSAGKTYSFNVLARDLIGNLARQNIQVQVLSNVDFSLYEVFNSPNPVRNGESTIFFFKLASEPDSTGAVDSRIQASIRIHTVSGKLVRILRTELSSPSQPRPRAIWDLRDSFGNPVANGLYPFAVSLRIRSENGGGTTEIIRKGIVAISR